MLTLPLLQKLVVVVVYNEIWEKDVKQWCHLWFLYITYKNVARSHKLVSHRDGIGLSLGIIVRATQADPHNAKRQLARLICARGWPLVQLHWWRLFGRWIFEWASGDDSSVWRQLALLLLLLRRSTLFTGSQFHRAELNSSCLCEITVC